MITDIEDLCSFVTLADSPNYEILNVFPFSVRNKKTHQILKPSMHSDGYFRYCLNKKQFRAHQLIAKTFIKNPNNHPCVDHKNRDKTDNSLRNLRWVSLNTNARNITKMKGDDYIWTSNPPADLTQIHHYNGWNFDRLFYSKKEHKFYTKVDEQYRELIVHVNPNGGTEHVSMKDVESGKNKAIYLNKFLREHFA